MGDLLLRELSIGHADLSENIDRRNQAGPHKSQNQIGIFGSWIGA